MRERDPGAGEVIPLPENVVNGGGGVRHKQTAVEFGRAPGAENHGYKHPSSKGMRRAETAGRVRYC